MPDLMQISPAGRLPRGKKELPFSLQLQPDVYNDCRGMLYETYHGVNVSIQVRDSAARCYDVCAVIPDDVSPPFKDLI